MNIKEAREKLASHGIKQLRRGESLQDAIDFVEGRRGSRVGYDVKRDDGTAMTRNEIIGASNREAFMKTVSPKEFMPEDVEDIDDIPEERDYREDSYSRGIMVHCAYCGDALRVDGEGEDWPKPQSTDNCEDCLGNAIAANCM